MIPGEGAAKRLLELTEMLEPLCGQSRRSGVTALAPRLSRRAA